MVMAPITEVELLAIINNSLNHKAPGLSSIPYECIARDPDIPKDWHLASIVPIPKPHEFECLLKNTWPITLLETARKLMVKIVTDHLSRVMSQHQVLTGNNFAGLPGSSVNTPINILDGIMKSHRVLQLPQELWILSQDISKAFDSIDLHMLWLYFDHLKFSFNLSDFIVSLFTFRKNRILTPFGKTESYDLLIGIDQGEVISPLLWTIYFDPLLTKLSLSAISLYIWSSGIPTDILNINNNENLAIPITQLTYLDNSTLIASSLSGLEQLLSIARDFYFLNNITANFSKYELISSSANNNLISFQLESEILDHLSSISFSLQALRLSSSFHFLGVWFNLQGSPNFVLSQLKDIYSFFVSSVRFKKLSPAQLAYLHSTIPVSSIILIRITD
ncbi:reverse transcriptase family protein [Rhizophagus irregularis DAOM 181602=DAOM 197198]|nr:reverse transcriptase family protein [Rhizophagus irregularis DAOM 181602=DAOM 197198]